MNAVTAFLLGTLIAVIFMTILYWKIIRPVFLKALLFRIFERRDKLRRMAIDGVISPSSPEYKYLEEFICRTIALIPTLNLLAFVYFSTKCRNIKSPESEEFEERAPENLKATRKQVAEDAIGVMVINSPIVSAVVVCLAPILWIFGKMRRITQKAEQFVNALDDPIEAPQKPVSRLRSLKPA